MFTNNPTRVCSQVQIWLTFEDSTYSHFARYLQLSIMGLILLSTAVMIAQSVAPCRFCDPDTETPSATHAHIENVCEIVSSRLGGYRRICQRRPTWTDTPIAEELRLYFALETICIGVFSIEYVLRAFSSPATIGAPSYCAWMHTHYLAGGVIRHPVA